MLKRKSLQAGVSLLKARILGQRVPLVVGWSLTNRCNLQCAYCTRWKEAGEELETEQILSIIDELAEMGVYSINFTGGEVLIREDIGIIIDYAKGKGINTGLSSNGLLIPQKIEEIKKIDSITLSFDGTEEAHNSQRCGGSYLYIPKAIEKAKEKGIHVKLHTVLTRNNIKLIDFILRFAEEKQTVVNFAVVEFNLFSAPEDIKKLLPSKNDYRAAIKRLLLEKIRGNNIIGNSYGGLKHLYQWPKHKKIDCCAGKIYCRIEANGDLYPCTNLINKVKPGNCLKVGFRKAFKSLPVSSCGACWCDSRIELNQIYSLNLNSALDLMKKHKL